MVMVNLPDNSGTFFPVIHPGRSQIQVALPFLYSILRIRKLVSPAGPQAPADSFRYAFIIPSQTADGQYILPHIPPGR